MPGMAVSTELQNTILQRQRDGATIVQIAQELGISRTTVYKSLTVVDNWEAWVADKSKNIRRLAYNAVERGLSKGDARLGLEWLKLTDLAVTPGDTYHVKGDVTMNTMTAMLPSPASSASTTSTPSPAGTTGTEAAANLPSVSTSISCHLNFSQISDNDLLTELERRGLNRRLPPIEATDAEIIGG